MKAPKFPFHGQGDPLDEKTEDEIVNGIREYAVQWAGGAVQIHVGDGVGIVEALVEGYGAAFACGYLQAIRDLVTAGIELSLDEKRAP